MKKRIVSFVLSLSLAALTLVGCGTSASSTPAADPAPAADSGVSSTAAADTAYSFAFLPNTQNNTFQSTMNDTFKTLCEEAGYEYVCLDPDYDLNTQLSQLSDIANRKPDFVFVIPVDSQGIRQGLEGLQSAGIPVINVDTPVVDEDRELVLSVIATDAYNAGVLVGEQMAKDYPDGAEIAILDFPENESCVNRVDGFLEGLGENKDKFTIVAQQNGAAALDVSMPIAEDIIQANPNLDAFFCINDPSSLGAAAAIAASSKSGIGVYSIDASPEGKAALVDGMFTAVAAQVPIQISEKAFECAVAYLDNDTAMETEILLPSFLVTKEKAEETLNDWQ